MRFQRNLYWKGYCTGASRGSIAAAAAQRAPRQPVMLSLFSDWLAWDPVWGTGGTGLSTNGTGGGTCDGGMRV